MSKTKTSAASRTSEPSIDDILKLSKANNVKRIRLQFVDILGVPKNMTVHVDQLEKALNNEILLDGSSIQGFRTIETSDMAFHPDRNTFQVMPWEERGQGVARVICDIYNPDGTPFEGCPRNNLRVRLEEARQLGFEFNVGPELEFFLFKRNADGTISTESHDTAGYYDLGPDDGGELVRGEIADMLEKLDFEMEAEHHEVSASQHEIDFKYSDALTQADRVTNAKIITRRIAAQHGLFASFMPKPVFGVNGSGMHCNMSLGTIDGDNAFDDPNGDYQLSKNAHYFIGGMVKHIRGITAVLNPLTNSYKRLVPGYEAPVYVAWSAANRSALLRVPSKRGKSTRIEVRSPDPAANPYLTFAVLLKAGLDGVQNKIEPPNSVNTNIYKLTETERLDNNIASLPGSLFEALEEYKKSDVARAALGDHIYEAFLHSKEREWDEYRMAVTPWELDQYLGKY